jgi:hypothetical protein
MHSDGHSPDSLVTALNLVEGARFPSMAASPCYLPHRVARKKEAPDEAGAFEFLAVIVSY